MFNPATLDTFLKIKKTFDPEQRINDGKLIPSDRLSIELLKPIAPNIPGVTPLRKPARGLASLL